MKRLLLFFLFSGSLDSFSQQIDSTQALRTFDGQWTTGQATVKILRTEDFYPAPKPDTLRAIILVTTSPNGIAHSRMGYVVIAEGRKPVYLTCDKKALKLPQVGWGWVEAGEGRR